MAEKNRQHYVPKFYLKNFANNERAIDTFNLTNAKYIQNASIKDMCQRHNFYGADNQMENFLAEEIESKANELIKKVLETNEFPQIWDDYLHLCQFLMISEARNLRTSDSTNHLADMLAKILLDSHPETQHLKSELDKFKIELDRPANMNIEIAIRNSALILDLKPLLIIEQTGGARKFITSDNPLIRYNSLYLKKGYPGGFSYIDRGAQFFFPISSHKCILLYDSWIYDVPEETNHVLYLKRARDVDQLNELLYLNAYNNVFFDRKTKKGYIESLHHKSRREPKMRNLERETSVFKAKSPRGGELIYASRNQVRKKFDFAWLKFSILANNLVMPRHMGGISREESPYISEFLKERELQFRQEGPGFDEIL